MNFLNGCHGTDRLRFSRQPWKKLNRMTEPQRSFWIGYLKRQAAELADETWLANLEEFEQAIRSEK